MSFDDSDSSDAESFNGITTNVFLGYASTDPIEDDFSHLGGYAVSQEPPTALEKRG